MTTLYLILQLAWTFFVIGAFTIGGGYAMLSLIQNQVVVEHPWISESAFTDIVAISQMTPGPIGINSATYVGYEVLFNATGSHVLGVFGSLTATLALILPSFIIMLLIVRFYLKFKSSKLYAGTMSWLKPCVVGLRLEKLGAPGRGLRGRLLGQSEPHLRNSGRRRAGAAAILSRLVGSTIYS